MLLGLILCPPSAYAASRPGPASHVVTGEARLVASVEQALRHNPNQEAAAARCRMASNAEIHRSPFRGTRRPVLRCTLRFAGGPHKNIGAAPAQDYDVMVLGNGCFVGARLVPGRGDSGCGAIRVPARRA